MRYTFQPMNESDAREILDWRYEGIYAVYNVENNRDTLAELLDSRSPYYAARNERNELVGFFCFGTAAEIWESDEPGIFSENKTITIGLGLRPDLTSKGHGLSFVSAGLALANEQFAPENFRLYVLSFNTRAIRIYERLGFTRVRVFTQRNIYGEHEFIEMSRKA